MKFQNIAAFGLSSSVLVTSLLSTLVIPSQVLANHSPEHLVSQQVGVVRSGDFITVEQNHQTTGKVRVINSNGKRYLELDSEFNTANGPDVQIILYKGSQVPQKVSEEDYITLAQLKSFDGSQRYEIPNNINPNDFKSVAIWCRKFNVTFGYATISS